MRGTDAGSGVPHPSAAAPHQQMPIGRKALAVASLGALGVVYGDIGTSPLYALRECLGPRYGIPPTQDNVLGLLSLIFWSLTLIVVVKYIGFVLRADNRGEGGILSLMALAIPQDTAPRKRWSLRGMVIALGIFGAALLFGDGMITPAITVLSAVEGLEVEAPALAPAVVPITLIILGSLFLVQRHGTGFVGAMFGPVMLVWFVVIGGLGLIWIIREPSVLAAVNPWRMIVFFEQHRLHGFLVLGAVILCVTGTEALYADLGHFGRRPIHVTWFYLVFPSLLLNYFGQGAVVIAQGQAAAVNPFFKLASGPIYFPLVILATMAGVIASQALISGSFFPGPAGGAAWLFAATDHHSHLEQDQRTNLCARDQRLAHDRLLWARVGVQGVLESGGRLRRGRHRHDGDDFAAAVRGGLSAMELEPAQSRRADRSLPRDRSDLLRLEHHETARGGLAAPRRRGAVLHADDHLEARPEYSGGLDRQIHPAAPRLHRTAGARQEGASRTGHGRLHDE